jgi:AraC-like DNA-binding protein
MVIVSAVSDALRQLGANDLIPESISLRTRELANDPLATMPRAEFQQLLLDVRDSMCEPALGLALGERLTEMSFRFFGALLATRMSLRDALTTFLSTKQTLLVGSNWGFVLQGDEAFVGVTLGSSVSDGAALGAELAVTALYRNLVHWLGEPQGRSVRACFSYAPPAHSTRYLDIFGPALRFHCTMCGIAFPHALLDQTRPGADQQLADAMSQLSSRWIPATDSPTWTSRAKRTFANIESYRDFSLESLASQWGISLRSLRRRLAEENTTLTTVLEAELYARASLLLTKRSHSLSEIAELLGYREVNSFQRAFRRWSGVTPAEFRRRDV